MTTTADAGGDDTIEFMNETFTSARIPHPLVVLLSTQSVATAMVVNEKVPCIERMVVFETRRPHPAGRKDTERKFLFWHQQACVPAGDIFALPEDQAAVLERLNARDKQSPSLCLVLDFLGDKSMRLFQTFLNNRRRLGISIVAHLRDPIDMRPAFRAQADYLLLPASTSEADVRRFMWDDKQVNSVLVSLAQVRARGANEVDLLELFCVPLSES